MTITIATTPDAALALSRALFGGRRSTQAGLNAAREALDIARAELPRIRALRHLTGNAIEDWCRGETRYRERRADILARIARCRAAVMRAQAELAAVIAEDAEIEAEVATAEARWTAQQQMAGKTVPAVRDRRAA